MDTRHQTICFPHHTHGCCHRPVARRAGATQSTDAAIGRLLNELEQLNLRENTLIIFASDNGAAIQAPLEVLNCNAGFKGRKGMLYEGGIRVPFIVNQPGKVPVQKLENMIYFPDMMPTLAAIHPKQPTWPTNTLKWYKSLTKPCKRCMYLHLIGLNLAKHSEHLFQTINKKSGDILNVRLRLLLICFSTKCALSLASISHGEHFAFAHNGQSIYQINQ